VADRPTTISVIGAGGAEPGSRAWEDAAEVGRLLAQEKAVLVCGGGAGVMAAAAEGAAGAGGTVIGIVPSDDPGHANPHCTHVVATGIGHARNLAVVASGAAVIAIGGEWGTLSEIGFARRLGRTVAALGSWRAEGAGEMADAPGIEKVEDAAAAVRVALEAAGA
jgi:uncharacterized protein (TIGR00725 family)